MLLALGRHRLPLHGFQTCLCVALAGRMKCRSSSKHSMYKRLIGKTVLVPGQEFGVDVPELYYRGVH